MVNSAMTNSLFPTQPFWYGYTTQRDEYADVTEPTISVLNTSLERAKNYSLVKEYPEIVVPYWRTVGRVA
jgi:hypothetical protein